MKLLKEYSPNKNTKFYFYLDENKQGKYICVHEYITMYDDRRGKSEELVVNKSIVPFDLLKEICNSIEGCGQNDGVSTNF